MNYIKKWFTHVRIRNPKLFWIITMIFVCVSGLIILLAGALAVLLMISLVKKIFTPPRGRKRMPRLKKDVKWHPGNKDPGFPPCKKRESTHPHKIILLGQLVIIIYNIAVNVYHIHNYGRNPRLELGSVKIINEDTGESELILPSVAHKDGDPPGKVYISFEAYRDINLDNSGFDEINKRINTFLSPNGYTSTYNDYIFTLTWEKGYSCFSTLTKFLNYEDSINKQKLEANVDSGFIRSLQIRHPDVLDT